MKLCEGNCLSDVGAINRFSEEQLFSVYINIIYIFDPFFFLHGINLKLGMNFLCGVTAG